VGPGGYIISLLKLGDCICTNITFFGFCRNFWICFIYQNTTCIFKKKFQCASYTSICTFKYQPS